MYDGETDEEMEDFVVDYFEVSEVDSEYEFDAARFFDFTRPESSFEAEDAERWFESARSYPPSPFIIKLKQREAIKAANGNTSLKSSDEETMISSSNNLACDMDPEEFVLAENKKGQKSHYHMAQDILKIKTKPGEKSSKIGNSTLMKPTACHLAKLNRGREAHSNRILGRSQKPLTKIDDRSSKNSLGVDSDATKRQKLENGYLRKVAHLKHQSLMSHKLPKVRQVDANNINSKLKVTVPREPDLETAHRAQRHRSRNNSESGANAKSKASTFKARPLKSKILKAPSLPPQKTSRRRSSFFQVFHFKTSERAIQHSTARALNMQNSESISKNGTAGNERQNIEHEKEQEKCETTKKVKARPLNKKIVLSRKNGGTFQNVEEEATLELQLSNDDRSSDNPPIELFKQLSLKSNVEHNVGSHTKPPVHPKGPKENVPGSFKQELRGYGRKQSQCGSDWRIPETKPRLNINRSMDIR